MVFEMGKNKIVALVLVAVMSASIFLSSCNNDDNPLVPSSDGKSNSSANTSSAGKTSEPSTPKVKYIKGLTTETSWTSEWANMKFEGGTNFILASTEEVNALMEGVDDPASYTEMIASDPTGAPNASVIVEKLPLANITVEQYMDSLEKQLKQADPTYKIVSTDTKVTVAGQEFAAFKVKASVQGTEVLQDYLLKKQDGRMIALIVTYTPDQQEKTDALMKCFTPVK